MKKIVAISMILLLLAAGYGQANTEAPASAPEVTDDSTAAPAATAEAPAAYAFPFTAKTLEGETMTEAVLGQYDLTMVNVWASWCPYCIEELPGLQTLYQSLPENVNFLSVTVDDPKDLDAARALLQQNGCTFPCLDGVSSPGLMNGFLRNVMSLPSTLFLDRNGDQVGKWIIGAPRSIGAVADVYGAEIRARLALLNAA